jgi:hypothetical protein
MLTLAVGALHSQRPARLVDDDHRVRTIGLAGAAEVFDFLAGAEGA